MVLIVVGQIASFDVIPKPFKSPVYIIGDQTH